MGVKIVTDSTSYLPKEYIEKYDISVISLNVILNGISRREVNISNEEFYKEMDKTNENPSSSQPTPEEVLTIFEDIVKNGDSVLAIYMSSELSGSYASGTMVKDMVLEKYPNAEIQVLDSKTTCMEMGYIVIEAARAAQEGKDMSEILAVCKDVMDHNRFVFTPETLEYLKKGGRIGGASALLGEFLQIKPILTVVDGKTSVLTKVRTRKKAIETIVQTFLSDIEGKELGGATVHHINCEEQGLELAKRIEDKVGVKVDVQSIGPIIGIHVGPGSIGVAYFTKEN